MPLHLLFMGSFIGLLMATEMPTAFAYDVEAEDRCFRALALAEPRERTPSSSPVVSININRLRYLWNGRSIRAYTLPGGVGLQYEKPETLGTEIWNPERGRLDQQIPSLDLEQAKRHFIQSSRRFTPRGALLARRHDPATTAVYDACQDLRNLPAPLHSGSIPKGPGAVSIGQRSAEALERLRSRDEEATHAPAADH